MTKKMTQTIIFMAIFLAGILYVYFQFFLKPFNAKYAGAFTQLEMTESKLVEMKQRALALPQLQDDMKLLETEVADLEQFLPREKEVPDLLRTVTNIAQRHGIQVLQFTPGAAVAKENYIELPYQLNVKGTYHSVARFLTDIGQGSRILSSRNAVFSFLPANSSKDSHDTVSVNFTLVAYTFKG